MSLLPPANTGLATRQDLDALETRIIARFDVEAAKVGTRFAQLEATIERRLTHSLRWTSGIVTALGLAAIGWITQVIGALRGVRGAPRIPADPWDADPSMRYRHISRDSSTKERGRCHPVVPADAGRTAHRP